MLLYSNMTRPPVLRGITIQISLPIPPILRALTSSSMLVIILFSSIPLVFGHGGMLWPPSWQNGQYKSIEMVDSNDIASDTPVIDPTTNREIRKTTAFLTDHTFVSGHGLEYAFVGEKTNQEIGKKGYCATTKTPWASPGRAPSLGGGCGLFRGNPNSCEGECTMPREVFSQGSSALDIEFPEAATTEWVIGSVQDVAWLTKGGHRGGYTYRLCRLPQEGKKGLTEECFAQNVLKFATQHTMMQDLEKPGAWKKVEQEDLTEGTYPAGSAWRNIVKISKKGDGIVRKDSVIIPSDLAEGDYVLSFRWDTQAAQVWVSCANIRLVA